MEATEEVMPESLRRLRDSRVDFTPRKLRLRDVVYCSFIEEENKMLKAFIKSMSSSLREYAEDDIQLLEWCDAVDGKLKETE